MHGQVVLAWQGGAQQREWQDSTYQAHVHMFASEEAMLRAWLALVKEADPDALVVYQVRCLGSPIVPYAKG